MNELPLAHRVRMQALLEVCRRLSHTAQRIEALGLLGNDPTAQELQELRRLAELEIFRAQRLGEIA